MSLSVTKPLISPCPRARCRCCAFSPLVLSAANCCRQCLYSQLPSVAGTSPGSNYSAIHRQTRLAVETDSLPLLPLPVHNCIYPSLLHSLFPSSPPPPNPPPSSSLHHPSQISGSVETDYRLILCVTYGTEFCCCPRCCCCFQCDLMQRLGMCVTKLKRRQSNVFSREINIK